ncbi:hypothetical protein SH668x_001737 [Planctomicrobium sp. SH668]|uniref:hypothetical protein n=1 Tax=Planctomicrobium sp. SH668 TaxID=3448126 RepID=UPI003F5C6386
MSDKTGRVKAVQFCEAIQRQAANLPPGVSLRDTFNGMGLYACGQSPFTTTAELLEWLQTHRKQFLSSEYPRRLLGLDDCPAIEKITVVLRHAILWIEHLTGVIAVPPISIPNRREAETLLASFIVDNFHTRSPCIEANSNGRMSNEIASDLFPPTVPSEKCEHQALKAKRTRMKTEDAEARARELATELAGNTTKAHWARIIGCDARTVEKLTVYQEAIEKRITASNKKTRRQKEFATDPFTLNEMNGSNPDDLSTLSVDFVLEGSPEWEGYSAEKRARIRMLALEQRNDQRN